MPVVARIRVFAVVVAALMAAACGASQEVRDEVAARNQALLAGAGGPASAAATERGVPGASGDAIDSLAPTPAEEGTEDAGAAGDGGSMAASGPSRSANQAVQRSAPRATTERVTGKPAAATVSGTGATGPVLPGDPAGLAGPAAPGSEDNGGATDVGVTGDTIKIGGLFFNGSWLDKYSQVAEQAASAYFRYVNDRGGIHGRKIQFVGCDTAGTVNGTQGCLRKLAEQDKVFSLGPSLDFNLDTAVPYVNGAKLPFVGSPGLYDAEFGSPYIFPTQYRGGEMGAIAATFMIQQQGAKRLGLSWNTQPPGPPCVDGVRRVAKALGAEIVVEASNGPTESDLSPQVIRIRSANPDAVIFCNDPVNDVKFVQSAGRQNYRPPAGWIGAFCLADDVPLAMGPAGVGFFCLTSYDPYFVETPGIAEMYRITRHYFPSHFHHAYTMPAFVGAKLLVEALQRTGPQLTRERLLATLRGVNAFDTRMGITFDYSSRTPPKASGIVAQADENLR
ncbi:MAG TPA: ABC transporter substrate-binding protein, partial [Acidimicrobiia bacterium]|nr:ABC transporter substrate-binding protein [Acidimicrobiia bacterium]